MPPVKPMAIRLLEQRKIPHEVFTFDATIRDAGEVAAQTGMPPELVYKTLVVELDPPKGRPFLVMVPSDSEIELKALAKAVDAKKLRMASHRDAEKYTGLQVGGISALALVDKGFPVLIDQRSSGHTHVLVSGGQRGYDVRIAVTDLIVLTKARPVPTS